MDTGTSPEWGEDWARIEKLIALARNAHRTELSRDRKDRIRDQVLDRLERSRERRRTVRAFAAGASTMLLVVLVLKLVSGWIGNSPTELARKPASQQVVAE